MSFSKSEQIYIVKLLLIVTTSERFPWVLFQHLAEARHFEVFRFGLFPAGLFLTEADHFDAVITKVACNAYISGFHQFVVDERGFMQKGLLELFEKVKLLILIYFYVKEEEYIK